MSLPQSLYRYSCLPVSSIRLLRLLPHQDKDAKLECKLCDCALADSGSTRPYEALSYVWGSDTKPQSISIDGCDLPVGENLFAALSHLRDCSIERTLWVDAICINQQDTKEKGQQVQSMAKIYAKASRVIVWLGKATPTSDQAIEDTRAAAEQPSKRTINKSAILELLEAAWFQRVWVLQEVAAARHILIKCGSSEIDGYAFCSGLSALDLPYETHPDLRLLILSVSYLIKGAVFRSRSTTSRAGRFSLNICPLAQLVDMYHTRQAGDRRDRVYALLGMSSDDPGVAGLSANYDIPWAQLFRQLINFIFDKVSVDIWNDEEIAVIRGKGCVLGKVFAVDRDAEWEDKQHVTITWTNAFGYGGWESRWTLQASAKSVQKGDFICMLQGATSPTIIRICNDYWSIIMVAAPPPDDSQTASSDNKSELLRLITSFPHTFLLVWDWNMRQREWQRRKDYEHLMGTLATKVPKPALQSRLDKLTRLWNSGVAMRVGAKYMAEENLHKALQIFATILRDMGSPTLTDPGDDYRTAGEDMEKLKLIIDLLVKSEGGWMPLSLAAKQGHEAIVKLLLRTGEVDPDAEDMYKRTPLSRAAENGHEEIIKLLLSTGRVDPDAVDEDKRTSLSWAAEKGHEAIVKLLLRTGKVDLEAKEGGTGLEMGRSPLSLAAENGHQGIVNLLIGTGKVNLNAQDLYNQRRLRCTQ